MLRFWWWWPWLFGNGNLRPEAPAWLVGIYFVKRSPVLGVTLNHPKAIGAGIVVAVVTLGEAKEKNWSILWKWTGSTNQNLKDTVQVGAGKAGNVIFRAEKLRPFYCSSSYCSQLELNEYSDVKIHRRDHEITLLMEEIVHQLIGSLSHHLQVFTHPKWLFGISSINDVWKYTPSSRTSGLQNSALRKYPSIFARCCGVWPYKFLESFQDYSSHRFLEIPVVPPKVGSHQQLQVPTLEYHHVHMSRSQF